MKPFNVEGVFEPVATGSNAEVRQAAVRGAGVTVFSGGVALVLQVASTMILARLLTPRDFGLVTMVTTFSLLLVNFGLNGFTEALVQRESLTAALASNIFWINTLGGLVLSVLFAAAGSLMARFYREPQVAAVAVGISATIFLTALSVVHLALLKRAMRFSALSVNDIRSRAVSVLVSIVFGFAGWGWKALVLGAIALPLSSLLGAWWLCRWFPGRPQANVDTRSTVRFAMHTYGRFSINYLARNSDNLLVGWKFNAQALGFYKKAYDLFLLPVTQLIGALYIVAVSALSRVSKDAAAYRRSLCGGMAIIALIGMGVSADLTLVGKDVIRLLLGPGWEEAGRIFMFFGPGIGAMMIYHTHGWIHLSIGRPDRWFRWGIFEFAVTVLLFFAGLPWGPVGIAVAWTVSFWLLAVPSLWYALQPTELRVGALLAVVWRYTLAALVAGSLTAAILHTLPMLSVSQTAMAALVRLLSISAIFTALYGICIVVLHGSFTPLLQLGTLIHEMLPANRASRGLAAVLGVSASPSQVSSD